MNAASCFSVHAGSMGDGVPRWMVRSSIRQAKTHGCNQFPSDGPRGMKAGVTYCFKYRAAPTAARKD